MSPSNLPPGVTPNMIPGNSPQDEIWERLMDWVVDKLGESGLSNEQVFAGIKLMIVMAPKENVDERTHNEMIHELYDV